MELKVRRIIDFGNVKYVIVATLEYNNVEYGFVTRLMDNEDEISNEYNIIYNDINGELKVVSDKNLFESLVPKFQEKVKDEISKFLN